MVVHSISTLKEDEKREVGLLAMERSEERQSGHNAESLSPLEIPPSLPGAAQGREVEFEVDWATTTWPKPRQPSRAHPVSGRGVVCRVPATRLLCLDLPMLALSFGLAVTASPQSRRRQRNKTSGGWRRLAGLQNDLSTLTPTGEQGLCPPRTLWCCTVLTAHVDDVSTPTLTSAKFWPNGPRPLDIHGRRSGQERRSASSMEEAAP